MRWYLIINTLLLVAVASVDWRWRRIPHWLTLAGCVVALAGRGLVSAESLISGLLGLTTAFTLFLAIYLLAQKRYEKNGFGFGDVMLAAMIGALLGPITALRALAFGLLLAGLYALWLLWRGRARRQTLIPFGPFLVLPALIVLWI